LLKKLKILFVFVEKYKIIHAYWTHGITLLVFLNFTAASVIHGQTYLSIGYNIKVNIQVREELITLKSSSLDTNTVNGDIFAGSIFRKWRLKDIFTWCWIRGWPSQCYILSMYKLNFREVLLSRLDSHSRKLNPRENYPVYSIGLYFSLHNWPEENCETRIIQRSL